MALQKRLLQQAVWLRSRLSGAMKLSLVVADRIDRLVRHEGQNFDDMIRTSLQDLQFILEK